MEEKWSWGEKFLQRPVEINKIWRQKTLTFLSVGPLMMFFIPKMADLLWVQKQGHFVHTDIDLICTLNSDWSFFLFSKLLKETLWLIVIYIVKFTNTGVYTKLSEGPEGEREEELSLLSETSTLMCRSWLERTTDCAWNTQKKRHTHIWLAYCPGNSPLTSENRLLPHPSPSSPNKLKTLIH